MVLGLGVVEVLAIAVGILTSLYYYLTRNYDYWQKQGVIGPKPTPVFGNTLAIRKKLVHELDIEWRKKYGKVYGVYNASSPALMVGDETLLREILIKDFNHFVDRRTFEFNSKVARGFQRTLTNLKGEEWKAARNVVTPSFTTGKMKQMFSLMQECCNEFLENCKNYAATGEELEIKKTFNGVSMNAIASCGFGIHVDALKNPKDPFVINATKFFVIKNSWVLIIFIAFPKILKHLGSFVLDIREAVEFFTEVIENVSTERKKDGKLKKRNDLLQLLLDARNSDTETPKPEDFDPAIDHTQELKNGKKYSAKTVADDEFVLAQSIQVLVAGFETTSSTLALVAYNLATNPDCQETLINEIDEVLGNKKDITYDDISESNMPYLDMVVSETLRIYPPATRLERKCTKDWTYENIHIKEGMFVGIPVYAMHHDEEYYPEPEKFIPERFNAENKAKRNPFTYLPFGAGPRNCIGLRFALLEVKLVLVTLLREIQFVTCSKTKIPLEFEQSTLLKTSIFLSLEARSK